MGPFSFPFLSEAVRFLPCFPPPLSVVGRQTQSNSICMKEQEGNLTSSDRSHAVYQRDHLLNVTKYYVVSGFHMSRDDGTTASGSCEPSMYVAGACVYDFSTAVLLSRRFPRVILVVTMRSCGTATICISFYFVPCRVST